MCSINWNTRNYRQYIKENYGKYTNDYGHELQYAGGQCNSGFAYSKPGSVNPWYCGKQKTGEKISNGPYNGAPVDFSYEDAAIQCQSNQAYRLTENTDAWVCGSAPLRKQLKQDSRYVVDENDSTKWWYLKQCPPNSNLYKNDKHYYCNSNS